MFEDGKAKEVGSERGARLLLKKTADVDNKKIRKK
jgi:hypothetical protein